MSNLTWHLVERGVWLASVLVGGARYWLADPDGIVLDLRVERAHRFASAVSP